MFTLEFSMQITKLLADEGNEDAKKELKVADFVSKLLHVGGEGEKFERFKAMLESAAVLARDV